jgi:hypothetical protein
VAWLVTWRLDPVSASWCAIVNPMGEAAGLVVRAFDLNGGDLGAVHVPLPVLACRVAGQRPE